MKRIIIYLACIGMGEVLSRTRKRKSITWKKLPLAVTPARYTLGLYEERQLRFDRATKHWIISANLGCDESMDMIREFYSKGAVSKEDFAAALRAHQASVDATKSPQRERADEVNRMTNR